MIIADMKRFIVYTTEGYTESPTFQEVQNCQVLGEVEAQNAISQGMLQ